MKKVMCLAVLFVMAACVQAGLNTPAVVNGSFEDAIIVGDDIAGWWDSAAYTYTTVEDGTVIPLTPYGVNWAELGNERWMYQQIGTYEENMDLDVTFLLGQKVDKAFQGVHVSLLVGGDPGLAADVNLKYYVENPLVTQVGAVEIANSGAIDPFAEAGMGTSEQTLSFNTGTGYTVGDPLWIQFNKVAGTGRILVDNVNVELPTTPTLVGPSPNGNPRVAIDADLEWAAPSVGVVDHYILRVRQGDPNFASAGTTVEDPATSPYDMGIMPYDTQYYWRVDVVDDQAATITGKLWSFTTVPEIPQIDVQPEGILVVGDGSASAQFTVAGLNIVNYAWQKDGAPLVNGGNIAGADTGTLTVSAVTPADEGLYSCVVDNNKGDVDETEAALLMTERLVAHLEFEGDLTDTQGNLGTGVVVDPNEVDTNVPDVGFGTGIIGSGALDLAANDGVAGYASGMVELPDSLGKMRFAKLGISVSAWVKVTNGDYYLPAIVDARDDIISEDTFMMNRFYGRGRWKNDGNLVTDSLVGTVDLNDGEWHLITGTYDGTTGEQKIYIDGLYDNVYVGLLAKTGFDDQSVVRIGGRYVTDAGLIDRAFKGLIDDVKIYSYPIDPVTIANFYFDGTGESTCIDGEGLEFDIAGGPVDPETGEPTGDCIINLADFAVFVADWLNCRLVPDCI